MVLTPLYYTTELIHRDFHREDKVEMNPSHGKRKYSFQTLISIISCYSKWRRI